VVNIASVLYVSKRLLSRDKIELFSLYIYACRRKSPGYGFQLRLFVSLSFFPHDISKTDATGFTKLRINVFSRTNDGTFVCFIMSSGKVIYFGFKKVTV